MQTYDDVRPMNSARSLHRLAFACLAIGAGLAWAAVGAMIFENAEWLVMGAVIAAVLLTGIACGLLRVGDTIGKQDGHDGGPE